MFSRVVAYLTARGPAALKARLPPTLHTLAIVLLARVVDEEPCAADDLETVEWFPLSGSLPEMAFEADAHICERYYQTQLEGAPVDPGYAVASRKEVGHGSYEAGDKDE